MQATRLVDYSDSEDDEEMEWREYHKQRSMLRMPRAAAPAPSVSTEDRKSPPRSQSESADRDFAFTPRKRAAFLRSAPGSSPFMNRQPPPAPTSSQEADFSFSPSFTESPLSEGDAKPPTSSWSRQQQSPQAAAEAPFPASTTSESAAPNPKPFTFGDYSATEAASNASPFAFGTQRTPTFMAGQPHRTTFSFDTPDPIKSSVGPSPFTFGSFKVADGGKNDDMQQPASFLNDLKPRRFASARVDGKTPQRQKDLHRAAKRRVSAGSAKGTFSSFGDSPASVKTTTPRSSFSPFAFGSVDRSSTKAPTMHSPMDVEMDENASTGNSSAFSFDSPKAGTAKPPAVFSFGAPSSSTTSAANPFRFDTSTIAKGVSSEPRGSSTQDPIMKGPKFAGSNSTSFSTQDAEFGFGSGRARAFSKQTKSTRDVTNESFSFGSKAFQVNFNGANSTVDRDSSAVPSRSASFSFEAAFKDFDAKSNPWAPANGKAESLARDNASKDSESSPFVMRSEKSARRESLEVRLARRRQEREAKEALDRQSQAVPRTTGAQKALFQTETPAQPTSHDQTDGEPNSFASKRGLSFMFGESQAAEEKIQTNIFQGGSKAPARPTSTGAASSSSSWSFKGASPFCASSNAGVFTFGTSTTVGHEAKTSPPLVDKLKSNFAGFNLGVADKPAKSKSSKGRPGRSDQASKPRSTFSTNLSGQNASSSSDAAKDSDTVPHSRANENSFMSTPPADPFVTPVFGQQRSNHHDSSMPGFGKNPAVPSPFSPNNPSHNCSMPVFGKTNSFNGSGRPQESVEAGNIGGSTPNHSDSFNMGASASAFLPGRRILRAYRPTQQRQPGSTDTTPESGGTEQSHRGWSEWKSLGGSAYQRQAYQEAADCYLNSIIVLENLLSDKPTMKTDQVMKDKAKLHSNRAAALMMVLQMTDAQRECYLSIESDPGYTRAYVRLGRIQVMLGDIEGAKESSITAKQLLSISESARRTDAADTTGIQKIEDAIEKLEKLRVEIKWCLDVHDYSRALSHLQEALAVAPHCRSLQTQKAQALFEQKNYAQVLEYCSGVIRKQKSIDRKSASPVAPPSCDPSNMEDNEVAMLGIELSMLRIRALHCENKVDDAMRHMQKLELAAPCSAKVIQLKRLLLDMKQFKHQANDLFKKGDYDQAQTVYSQALLLDPTNDEYCAVIYCNRAASLMGLQQYESALNDCNAALRRKARYPRCLLRRARCNVALKRYAAAVADFDRYLKEHSAESSTGSSVHEVEQERQNAIEAMENEAEERRRKEEQQRKERQKATGRSKPKQQQQQQRRHNGRHAWDDSKFYEEFWRSSSSSAGENRRQSSGTRGSNSNAAVHSKHRRAHYEVLGIAKSATQDEIKKAYRKLALLHHPDKAKDTAHADLFKDMTAAYNILSDPTARAKYDRETQFGGYGRYYEY